MLHIIKTKLENRLYIPEIHLLNVRSSKHTYILNTQPSNAVAPPPPPPAPDVVLPLRTPTRLQTPAGRAPNQFTRLQEQFRQQQAQKLQQNFQLNQQKQQQVSK